MRILMVGGTGLISSELAHLARSRGDDVTLINRGTSTTLPVAPGARVMHADATNPHAMRAALQGPRLRGEKYDAVVQFVAYHPDHVRADVETFARLTDHYVLIATAAAYQTYGYFRPLTEDTPLSNPFWRYAQLKIACEESLREAAPAAGLDYSIVRPAHTYGPSKIPAYTGNSAHPWTIVDRMRRGADIVIPGDGTAVWTITHARDVAAGIRGLLDNPESRGAAVHITSDEALTWTQLYGTIANAAGLTAERFAKQCVFVPTEAVIAADSSLEGSLRGDKMHNAVYNTALIKTLVPGWKARTNFASGVAEAIEWFQADPARQTTDAQANAMFDRLASAYRNTWEKIQE